MKIDTKDRLHVRENLGLISNQITKIGTESRRNPARRYGLYTCTDCAYPNKVLARQRDPGCYTTSSQPSQKTELQFALVLQRNEFVG
jgi:hypothetical protein